MDIQLLKQLGNMEQIAGIREARILRGRGEGIEIAEVYNARDSAIPSCRIAVWICTDFPTRG